MPLYFVVQSVGHGPKHNLYMQHLCVLWCGPQEAYVDQ